MVAITGMNHLGSGTGVGGDQKAEPKAYGLWAYGKHTKPQASHCQVHQWLASSD